MKHRSVLRIAAAFALSATLVGVTELSARSFPSPGNDDERSLLGVYALRSPDAGDLRGRIPVEFDGPEGIKVPVSDASWDVHWFRVDPGLYALRPSDELDRAPGIPDTVDVPPGSVVLAPFVLVRSASGISTARIDEGHRQQAGRRLASMVDFPAWSRRDLIGFGSLRPELDPETLQFTVSVESEPTEAEVYVDDLLMGTAPLEFALAGGKHRILVRSAGFEDAVYYVRLEGDAQIEAALEPAAEQALSAGSERYRTIVGAFVPIGEPDDQLARLFADTLLLTLEEDPRLDPLPSAIPWVQRDALIHPDFLPLEEVGADLVVSGFFGDQDGRLTVQANLYDVQAETVRAAVTWYGTAGFDIFDAMDEVALEFADEVDRVLPEAGRTLVTRRETVYAGGTRTDSLLLRKKVVRKRWQDNPNVLTVDLGFGGLFEEIPIEGVNASTTQVSRFDGPYFPLMVSWDRDLAPRFAYGASAELIQGVYRYDEVNNKRRWSVIGSLRTGPRFVFRSLRADILVGVDVQVRYAPELEYFWDEGVPDNGFSGPFLYLDLPIHIGFRYYVNDRIDAMPVFISGGLGLSSIGYRIDLKGRDQGDWLDGGILFKLGAGVRL